jgi:hypothetical protein
LTIAPQVYGWDKSNTDRNTSLSLNDFEKCNIRLLVGINF